MYNDILILAVYHSHDGGRNLSTVVFWAEMSSILTLPKTQTLLANIRLHKHAASGVA
jgi:peptidoglycan hydrolase-like amidase